MSRSGFLVDYSLSHSEQKISFVHCERRTWLPQKEQRTSVLLVHEGGICLSHCKQRKLLHHIKHKTYLLH